LLDDLCFPAAEPSFSKCLQQNEIIFQATLKASQQRFEHTLQLSHMAFEAQMEHLQQMCSVMQWPPICTSVHTAITSNSCLLSRSMKNHTTTTNTPDVDYANGTGTSTLNTMYPSLLNTAYLLPSGDYNTAASGTPWFKSCLYVLLPFLQLHVPEARSTLPAAIL